MALQRYGVAVIEMEAKRLGVEFINEPLARIDNGRDAIQLGWMNAVEVNCVRVSAAVDKVEAQPIPFRAAERGAGNLTVVRPRREENAGRDFDLFIAGKDI